MLYFNVANIQLCRYGDGCQGDDDVMECVWDGAAAVHVHISENDGKDNVVVCVTFVHFSHFTCLYPLPSNRQHLSYDVCLEVRGEIIRTVLCCIVY